MPGKTQVHLSDQVHRRSHVLRIQMAGLQCPVAEVVIDMPQRLAVPLGRDTQQDGTMIAQADGGKPPFDDQLIALSDVQLHAFDHHRANPPVKDKTQAVNARAAGGEPLLIEDLARGGGSAQNRLQRLTEFDQRRLAALFKQVVETFDHVMLPRSPAFAVTGVTVRHRQGAEDTGTGRFALRVKAEPLTTLTSPRRLRSKMCGVLPALSTKLTRARSVVCFLALLSNAINVTSGSFAGKFTRYQR